MLNGWCGGVRYAPNGVEGCGPAPPGRPQPAGTDREILLRFHAATGGPEGLWADAANWGSERPLAQWYGVFVDGAGRVESLLLAGNGLAGAVPASLGRLTGLTALDLTGNRLSGPLPAELGALAQLDFLALGRNRLTGPIPAEWVRLTRLRVLDLSRNRLTGRVPEGLGALPRLEILRLAHNRLQAPDPDKWSHIPHAEFRPQGTGADA